MAQSCLIFAHCTRLTRSEATTLLLIKFLCPPYGNEGISPHGMREDIAVAQDTKLVSLLDLFTPFLHCLGAYLYLN